MNTKSPHVYAHIPTTRVPQMSERSDLTPNLPEPDDLYTGMSTDELIELVDRLKIKAAQSAGGQTKKGRFAGVQYRVAKAFLLIRLNDLTEFYGE